MKLIVDSYAWVEFLLAGPHGPEVRKYLAEPHDLMCPDVVLPEVARRLARDDPNLGRIAGHLRSMTTLSAILPIDTEVAIESIAASSTLRIHAQRRKLGPPSFTDAIILAFARRRGARVLTGDPHFEGLSDT
ncbi:MAG TPA: PIN domain-containing protein, partial [Thermoplasmata archaeon]|nr:PIN domain-containing protein [Thermoplasmata archaeon]